MKIRYKNKQKGVVLLISIVVLAIMVTMASAIVGYTTLQLKAERQSFQQGQALALAEAGIDKAIDTLNTNPSYSGETATPLGGGEFTVTVNSLDSNNKQITATGYIPSAANPTATKIVKAGINLSTTSVAFNFGVQIGAGGLTMGNGSQVNGNIFSNGSISGSGTITGNATVAGGTAPTADQSWTVQNAGALLGSTAALGNLAQSFIPTTTLPINKVSVYLRKSDQPTDITVRILTDNSGVPSQTVLTSGTISASAVTDNYGFIDSSFGNSATLTAGTTYWIMLSANVDSANYFDWGYDSNNGYPNGTGKSSQQWNARNPSWNNVGGSFDFQTWMGGVVNSISGVTVSGSARANMIQNCAISGNAYYASVNTCTVGGTLNPGQTDTAPQALPISNAQIASWENTASGGGVITGNYIVNGSVTLGPKKIDGDLTVNGTLNLTGPVWVTGDIYINNGSSVTVDASLGNSGAVLFADNPTNALKGLINVSNNSIFSGNGNPGSYPMILTTLINNAINLGNNSSGAIFYASRGTINVSNNAVAKQLTGYSINLNNNAIINYTNGLASSSFSSGPGGAWQFTKGSYIITK
ncbi:MAG: hypothetical protein NVS3B9_5500 [Candidatus Doudnabacteria bacterium]